MKCDSCVFFMKKLDTCLFCEYVKDTKVDEEFLNGMKERLEGEYPKYVEQVYLNKMNLPKCPDQEKEEFDILELDDEECDEWNHHKILHRLHNHNIRCFHADIWGCDEVAYLVGVNAPVRDVAKVLGLHEECIYNDWENNLMILNLFQEKYLRGLLD